MSSRVIRSDIVFSETVTSLHYETRWLYLALILSADDYGLLSLSYGDIRRATPMDVWNREKLELMLGELVDRQLLIPYEDHGRRLGAIAKWRSEVRSVRPKWAIPPWGLTHVMEPYRFKDSMVRQAASLLLKHLNIESVPPVDPQGTPRVYPGPEGVRGKGKRVTRKRKNTSSSAPPGFDRFWAAYPHYLGRSSRKASLSQWSELKCEPETDTILAAIERQRSNTDWTHDGNQFVQAAQRWLKAEFWRQSEPPGPDDDGLQYLRDQGYETH